MSSAGGGSSQLVRYKHHKHHFEVLTKPGSVLKYRDGKLGFDNVLLTDDIFTNSTKGERPTDTELAAVFGAISKTAMLEKILKEGELSLSAAERKAKVDEKRKQMVNYIHKYYVDPRNHLPHPVVRIEAAFDELKIKVDPDIPSERQVQDVLKKLPEQIPLKKMEVIGVISVPHAHVGHTQGIVMKYCTIIREDYDSNGCNMEVSLVPGDYDPLMNDIAKISKGEVTFNVTSGLGAMVSDDNADPKAAKGKHGSSKKGKK